MSITEIESAIRKLPASEVRELVTWLDTYREELRDKQILDDLQSGNFDSAIAEAFESGDPTPMTKAEKGKLEERALTGVRLSCQIVCDHDMTVRAISRLAGSGRPDPGKTPEPTIQPPAEWT